MKKLFALVWMAVALACAQPALAPPQTGFMLDGGGALRPVFGIAGNFVIGDAVATEIRFAAYSGTFGIVKTGSAVVVLDRQGQLVASVDAPPGPALFAFSRGGDPALVYVSDANVLLRWRDGTFEAIPFASDPVVSIAALDSARARLIVQRDDGLWDVEVLVATGEILSQAAIPDVAPPVLLLATGDLVYGGASGIVIRKPGGAERHIDAPLPASFAFQQMGDGWVQFRDLSAGREFALRVAENREQFYQLPEADQ